MIFTNISNGTLEAMFKVCRKLRMSVKIFRSCLGTVQAGYKFASFVKSVPFQLMNDVTGGICLEPFSAKWKSCLWYAVTILMYTYAPFQIFSFASLISAHGLNTESAIHISFLVYYGAGILDTSVMLRSGPEFLTAVNGLQSLLKTSKGTTCTSYSTA